MTTPAFPHGPGGGEIHAEDGGVHYQFQGHPGMDLRDWFAGLAMQGMLSTVDGWSNTAEAMSRIAYDQADEMMKEREKNEQ